MYFLVIVLLMASLKLAATDELILTTLIKQNRIEDARNASEVDPGLFLGVKSHSGFFTVDETYNSNLFFWYFPVERKVNETPWIIWLQGGPGASSVLGLFNEIGPFEYTDTLKLREWSWGKNYSLLFIDNPVGAGFSFTDNDKGYATNMETYTTHMYTALKQFLTVFSELRNAPLYVAGESYAGRYVPALAREISNKNTTFSINLKGLMMGNPVLERKSLIDLSSAYYNVGLIDALELEAVKPLQEAYRDAVEKDDYKRASEAREELLKYMDEKTMLPQSYNYLKNDMDFSRYLSYLKQKHVSEAIHVGEGTHKNSKTELQKHLLPDFLAHTTPIVEELLEKFDILIYCGQLDLVAPCVPNALARRRTWWWPHKSYFMTSARHAWYYNNSVAGYVKSGGGLTEVLLRGAGHLAPVDNPGATFAMMSQFITKELQKTKSAVIEINFPLEVSPTLDIKYIIMLLSLILNVVLVAAIMIWFIRKVIRNKERHDSWLYNAVDERIDNNVLEIV